MRKVLLWIGGIVVTLAVILGILFAVYVRPFMSAMMVETTVHVDPQLTLILGGGGNSGILVGDSSVLVIDTKFEKNGQAFYDTVKQLAGNKKIIVVNTHLHSDHSGGNKFFKGNTIIAGGNYDQELFKGDAGPDGMATEWLKDSLVLKIGDETVTVLNMPTNGHTQSDVMVYLHNHKMIFAGDVVLNKQAPAMFKKYNASADGYLADFDLIEKRFDIKYVVPGHGENGGVEVIDTYRQFFKDMETAATDDSKKDELVAKYKDWRQVPMAMSPAATVSYIKKEKSK